jgi:hypothetical protein
MPTSPLRSLGAVGVITDTNPYDLPNNAFSDCNNVIFEEKRVQRAPVFKQLFSSVRSTLAYDESEGSYDSQVAVYESAEGDPTTSVRFVGSYQDPLIGEVVFICDNDGVVRTYPNGDLFFASPGTGLITNEEPWTHAQVAGVSVLARKGMRPYVRNIKADPNYTLIGGDWPSDTTAAITRGFLDYIIMLNVTHGETEYPTMVKWSNPVEYGAATSTINWDPSNPNFIAGENVIGDLKTAIRDAGVLGNQFIIYAQDQVWLMEYTGSSFVFNFRRLFSTGGIINTNCWTEVEGKHFVLGEDDIYVHDGNTKKSIADGRVRRKVFQTMDRTSQRGFFTLHDSVANLVYFCYRSRIDEVGYTNTQFCNRAAVYNYREDTWSFMDLPNIVGGAEANISLLQTLYSQLNTSFQSYNTNYVSFEVATPKLSIMLGATDLSNGLTESRIYAIDLPSSGLVNLPLSPETLKEAFVERVGIDLDEGGSSIRNYKMVTTILPQSSFDSSTASFKWQVGAADLPNNPVVWYSTQVFNPSTDYKLDMKVAGRYLAYKVSTNDFENFKFSGFDVDLKQISRR